MADELIINTIELGLDAASAKVSISPCDVNGDDVNAHTATGIVVKRVSTTTAGGTLTQPLATSSDLFYEDGTAGVFYRATVGNYTRVFRKDAGSQNLLVTFEPTPAPIPPATLSLDDNSDVDTTGATDGQSLVLEDGVWVPGSPSATVPDLDGDVGGPVGGNEINPGAVTETKIDDDAVSARTIATNAVTADAIATGAVGTGELGDGAATTAKIAAGAATPAKLAPDVPSIAVDFVPGPLEAPWVQACDFDAASELAFSRIYVNPAGYLSIENPDSGPALPPSATDAAAHGAFYQPFGAPYADEVEVEVTVSGVRPLETTPLIHVVEDTDSWGIGVWPIHDLFTGIPGAQSTLTLGVIGRNNLFFPGPDADGMSFDVPWGQPFRLKLRSVANVVTVYLDGVLVEGLSMTVPVELRGSHTHGVALDFNQSDGNGGAGGTRPGGLPGGRGPLIVRSLVPGAEAVASGAEVAQSLTDKMDRSGGTVITGILGATEGTRIIGMTASGVPSTGGIVGDRVLVFDEATEYVCTVAGGVFTPGTWEPIGGSGFDPAVPVTLGSGAGGSFKVDAPSGTIRAAVYADGLTDPVAGIGYVDVGIDLGLLYLGGASGAAGGFNLAWSGTAHTATLAGGSRIIGLPTPTDATEVAPKGYVDTRTPTVATKAGRVWEPQPPANKPWRLLLPLTGATFTSHGSGAVPSQNGTVTTVAVAAVAQALSNLATPASLNGEADAKFNTQAWYRGAASDVFAGWFFHARVRYPDASYNQTGATTGSRICAGMSNPAAPAGGARGGANHVAFFNREHVNGSNQDTNWQFVTNDGGATATVADTTLPFIVGNVYDLWIWCPAGATSINWQIDNVTAGTTASGSATADLPGATTAIYPGAWIRTIDAVARSIQVARLYIEADKG